MTNLGQKAFEAKHQAGKLKQQEDTAFDVAAEELYKAVKDDDLGAFKKILKSTLNIHRDAG